MIVALGGMVRNGAHYLPRYFGQVDALEASLAARGDQLVLVIAEGDSLDDTWSRLHDFTAGRRAQVIKRAHGGPAWGSVDDPARWKALSWVCNGVLEALEPTVDVFVYVEMDLAWDAATMIGLIDQLDAAHPAIAPMCFTAVGDFYDIWGHIKNGENFGPFPPYHRALEAGLTQIDSAGSCQVMTGALARAVRFGPDDLVRGLGRSIYEQGGSLWVDPTRRVVHL